MTYRIQDPEAPTCGCRAWDSFSHEDGDCLYPQAIAAQAFCERKLSDAREILKALILEAAWAGSPAIRRAEAFLKGES
jgi:hypothetical protein